MSCWMRRLFHSRRTPSRGIYPQVPSAFARTERTGTVLGGSSVAEGMPRADRGQPLDWPLFVGFEALAERRDAILRGLIPLHETTALVTFIGMGIADVRRYEDEAATFVELRRMAPAHIGAFIQVYTQKHREESKGNDFLYLHFAGDDRFAFGFLICALIGGGFMAGWQLG